jgi:predicted Zn-ribbon and HTH transcriptional regulator
MTMVQLIDQLKKRSCPECLHDFRDNRKIVMSSGHCPYCGKLIFEVDNLVYTSGPRFTTSELDDATKQSKIQDSILLKRILLAGLISLGLLFLALLISKESVLPQWIILGFFGFFIGNLYLQSRVVRRFKCWSCAYFLGREIDSKIIRVTGRCTQCSSLVLSDLPEETVVFVQKSSLSQSTWKTELWDLVRMLYSFFVILTPCIPLMLMIKLFDKLPITAIDWLLFLMIIYAVFAGYLMWFISRYLMNKFETQIQQRLQTSENQCPSCKGFHANTGLAIASKRCPDCRVRYSTKS